MTKCYFVEGVAPPKPPQKTHCLPSSAATNQNVFLPSSFPLQQSIKTLLSPQQPIKTLDARWSLHSDQRLLVARLDFRQMFNVWGCIEKSRSSKRTRYNMASDPYYTRFCNAVLEALPEINPNISANAR